MIAPTSPCSRADVNRANSQHSTGPTSSIGRARSAQNAFKHGLYSKQLILPGEDPAEFDQLRATLRTEHQPTNTTEEILVDELAQSFWRMRRFREFETRAFQPESLDDWNTNGLMILIQRSMASAERSFHKSLTALSKLQKRIGREPGPSIQRSDSAESGGRESVVPDQENAGGFVPQKPVEEQTTAAAEPRPAGFVPQKTTAELAAFEYIGYFPEDHDEYVESIVNSRLHARHNTEPSPE